VPEELAVPESLAGERVDRAVALLTGWSRSEVQALVEAGSVLVDGQPVAKSRRLARDDIVEVLDEPTAPGRPQPDPTITIEVRHEDPDLVVLAKPAGLVVHPGAGHPDGTLVNGLLARYPELADVGDPARPGIVHRLDRDTSGLLMVARTDAAQHSLMAQLKARRIKKTYLALVLGEVSAEVGRIEAPIGRDPKHRTRMAVVKDGRTSTTGYRVRERFAGWTLLELDLVTGRTHQIRVHLEAIGHPVAGDPVYGTGTSRKGPQAGPAGAPLERLFLHAWRLQLTSPSDGHLIRAEAPLPPELERVLAGLRAAPDDLAGPDGRR
jgi:23S rRNA pseudouridine1911/1915/1917 synthase